MSARTVATSTIVWQRSGMADSEAALAHLIPFLTAEWNAINS
jgi:hypothetical protein